MPPVLWRASPASGSGPPPPCPCVTGPAQVQQTEAYSVALQKGTQDEVVVGCGHRHVQSAERSSGGADGALLQPAGENTTHTLPHTHPHIYLMCSSAGFTC